MVGQEREPLPDLHRRLELGVDLPEEPDEVAGAVGVPPQLRGRPAAVALPPGRLERPGRGEQHPGRAGRQRQVRQWSILAPPRRPAVARDVPRPGQPAEGLTGRGQCEDVARRGPAAAPGAAPPGQPACGAAVGVRDEDLGRPLAPRRPRHAGPVRGQPRRAHRNAVRGEPVGAATGHGRGPDVVLGDEDQGVATQVGEAEVAGHAGDRSDARAPAGLTLSWSRPRGRLRAAGVAARPLSGRSARRPWPAPCTPRPRGSSAARWSPGRR
jgi:hypothetical protein